MELDPKYMDYAASTPPWLEALEVYVSEANSYSGNPSSQHHHGKKAYTRFLELKKELCSMVNFPEGRFLCTSSGSEANTTIIEGHLNRFKNGKILVAEDVHDSIWYATLKHEPDVDTWKVDKQGHLDNVILDNLKESGYSMVCMSHVCNETGLIHPVEEIALKCHLAGVKLLIDGMQAIGHSSVDMSEIPCNYYTISGHKFGAVKGTGGIFIRDAHFDPLILGGKQQWNLRSGTEDVAGLASMVMALHRSLENMDRKESHLSKLSEHLIDQLSDIPNIQFNRSNESVSGILSISILGQDARELVQAMSAEGFSISTGSACHASNVEPSRILIAMTNSTEMATGSIRISLGRGNTMEAVNAFAEKLSQYCQL